MRYFRCITFYKVIEIINLLLTIIMDFDTILTFICIFHSNYYSNLIKVVILTLF